MDLTWFNEDYFLLVVLLLIKNMWLEPRKQILFPISVILFYLKEGFLDKKKSNQRFSICWKIQKARTQEYYNIVIISSRQ